MRERVDGMAKSVGILELIGTDGIPEIIQGKIVGFRGGGGRLILFDGDAHEQIFG